jgi:hypothetical protein
LKNSKVKVKLKSSGVVEVLKSQFMMDALLNEAERHGEVDSSFVGFDRCHVIVRKDKGDDND